MTEKKFKQKPWNVMQQTLVSNLLKTPPKLIALSVLPIPVILVHIYTRTVQLYTKGWGNNNYVEKREKTKVKEEKEKSEE